MYSVVKPVVSVGLQIGADDGSGISFTDQNDTYLSPSPLLPGNSSGSPIVYLGLAGRISQPIGLAGIIAGGPG